MFTAATGTAGAARPGPSEPPLDVGFYRSVVPGYKLATLRFGQPVGLLVQGYGGVRVSRDEVDVQVYEFQTTIRVHLNRHRHIDGLLSTDADELTLYRTQLSVGYRHLRGRLSGRGWTEGNCSNPADHYASLLGRHGSETYVVWTRHGVTVALGTAPSRSPSLRDCHIMAPLIARLA